MALPALARRYAITHLRAARQTWGVPIETVARRVGIALATIEDIEAGRTGWRILCRWHGLDVSGIFRRPQIRLVAPVDQSALPPT